MCSMCFTRYVKITVKVTKCRHHEIMSESDDRPIAYEAYEELAEAYDARIATKPHNAYYDRPAVLSLLPDVQGLRVLDAGCGPGAYAEILAERGAQVVAVDASPKMISMAKKRLGDRAQVFVADISKPVPGLEDASFDLVVSPLVLNYMDDLAPVYQQFYRLLKMEGHLVASLGHPFFDFIYYKSDNYFATEKVGAVWKGFGKPVYVPAYRHSLSAILNPLLETGFTLERILEPLPTEEFKKADPEEYEKLMRYPSFIYLRARK
jgi:SAM-dependent methyltransferase